MFLVRGPFTFVGGVFPRLMGFRVSSPWSDVGLGWALLTIDEVASFPSCSPPAADPGDWMGMTDLHARLDCSTVMTRTYVGS